jgi:DNA-binding IclR family transcriptional regulator
MQHDFAIIGKYVYSGWVLGEAAAMNKIVGTRTRVLHILGLFEQQTIWTVDALATRLGVSSSSVYRDVQELSGAGFLNPVSSAGYVLGSAFIRYDRLIRQSDPLIARAAPIMRALLTRTTQSATVVLCRRFRDCVMCVHQEEGEGAHEPTSYERGVAMPLFKGATSKAILAHSDDRTLRAVYLENEEAIRSELCCASWKQFREEMRAIRDCGFAITVSEVAVGRAGVAAPILADRQVIAGLSLVVHERDIPTGEPASMAGPVVEAARQLSEGMAEAGGWRTRA